ncbi:hypothetical protein [Pantoea sp. PGP6]
MKKYPHGLTLNAVCAAIDDYQRHEDSVPEEGILAAFNTLLGHSDIAAAFRALEQRAEAAEALNNHLELAVRKAEGVSEALRRKVEAAEAKLAELAKQEPVYQFICNRPEDDGYAEWADCNADYFSKEPSDMRRILFTRPAAATDIVPGEWTNEQCLEFLSIAFRHAEISGDIEMDDIRLAVKMVNAGVKNH